MDITALRGLSTFRLSHDADGALVLKSLDCDEVIKRWRQGDERLFQEQWRLEKVSPTWSSRGVDDTPDSRAAYYLCGFRGERFNAAMLSVRECYLFDLLMGRWL